MEEAWEEAGGGCGPKLMVQWSLWQPVLGVPKGKKMCVYPREKGATQEVPFWEMIQLGQDSATICSKRLPHRRTRDHCKAQRRGLGEAP